MEWEYKNIIITVDNDGFFIFKFNNEIYEKPSLKEAKSNIDSLTNDYYRFTQKDMDNLMKKLSKRERELVRSLYNELNVHMKSAYCQVDICEDTWKWEWDFTK